MLRHGVPLASSGTLHFSEASPCPLCCTILERVHSRYVRQVADLPWAGRCVLLWLVVQRFLCDLSDCRRWIFAEWSGRED
ncbi:MAG: hypothetical protein DI601_10275 [Azospirillum brasilense]|nr:MAG: hypothetical protein DI601_10275 [Azospirillum brasilense]